MSLKVVPLTWELAREFAPTVSIADAVECRRMGMSVEFALMTGIFEATIIGCRAYAVVEDEKTVVGAFGTTHHGAIWSLWANLTRAQKLQVLQETPEWVATLKRFYRHHGRPPLGNLVDADNKQALDWIRHTGCFEIAETPDMRYGTPFYRFEVK